LDSSAVKPGQTEDNVEKKRFVLQLLYRCLKFDMLSDLAFL
jgi:hypothetical protein